MISGTVVPVDFSCNISRLNGNGCRGSSLGKQAAGGNESQ